VLQHLVGDGQAERSGGEGQGVAVGDHQRPVAHQRPFALGVAPMGVDQHVGPGMRGMPTAHLEDGAAIVGHAPIPPSPGAAPAIGV